MNDVVIYDLKEIIMALVEESDFETTPCLKLSNTQDEQSVIEHYIKTFFLGRPSTEPVQFYVNSYNDRYGMYNVEINGIDYKIDFKWVMH